MEWKFNINPVAASRPRVGKWGAYYTGTYKDFREEAIGIVYDVLGSGFTPLSGELAVSIELYVKRPKTTERGWPKADIDNFAKAVLDVMNGKIWDDDSQITTLHVSKQWASKGEDGYFVLSVSDK
jgi:Holliday junction resolvase RusA-like endonuclease